MQEQANGLLERAIKRLMLAGRDSFLGNRDAASERLALDPELTDTDEQAVMRWIDSCLAEAGGQGYTERGAVSISSGIRKILK